jgi:hypothetical protein
MKNGFLLGTLLLVAVAGCGRVVSPESDKKAIVVADPVSRRADKADGGVTPVAAPQLAHPVGVSPQEIERQVSSKAAEDLEKSARQFDQVGNTFSVNMMYAALAWQRAGDKDKALAAAKSAIAAGPNDRSPLDTCIWHTNIADVLLYAGEVPLAAHHYEAALKSAPDPFNAVRTQRKLDAARAQLGN